MWLALQRGTCPLGSRDATLLLPLPAHSLRLLESPLELDIDVAEQQSLDSFFVARALGFRLLRVQVAQQLHCCANARGVCGGVKRSVLHALLELRNQLGDNLEALFTHMCEASDMGIAVEDVASCSPVPHRHIICLTLQADAKTVGELHQELDLLEGLVDPHQPLNVLPVRGEALTHLGVELVDGFNVLLELHHLPLHVRHAGLHPADELGRDDEVGVVVVHQLLQLAVKLIVVAFQLAAALHEIRELLLAEQLVRVLLRIEVLGVHVQVINPLCPVRVALQTVEHSQPVHSSGLQAFAVI
eukprot:Sspe_Gene.19361::Locus_7051_Transcript_1_1_Confidence_1.000_Length_1226::g.19361::m.19361